MLLFLLQSMLIVGLPFVLWRFGGLRHWLPLAVVQIAVGLALGNWGLGSLHPDLHRILFPPSSLPVLQGPAWLGLVLFAFSTGLHMESEGHRRASCAFVLTSLTSVLIPALTGFALVFLLPEAMVAGPPRFVLAAGVGIALAVTALPVLAAIIRDMNLTQQPVGQLALACAAVSDGILWLGLAALLGSQGSAGLAWWHSALGAAVFAAVQWWGVRPALKRCQDRWDDGFSEILLLSLGLLLSAAIGEALGLHAVLGAFVFGGMVPKNMAARLLAQMDRLLMALLLPYFFVVSGLQSPPLPDHGLAGLTALLLLVAFGTKMLAALAPWRFCGWPLRQCLALGSLITCKGMMELVVLSILYQHHLLSADMYAALLLMALISTALARPLAELFRPRLDNEPSNGTKNAQSNDL